MSPQEKRAGDAKCGWELCLNKMFWMGVQNCKNEEVLYRLSQYWSVNSAEDKVVFPCSSFGAQQRRHETLAVDLTDALPSSALSLSTLSLFLSGQTSGRDRSTAALVPEDRV